MDVVLGLSGGMDSATLLGHYLERGARVHCCIFSYGSKHNPYENAAALRIINYYRNNGFVVAHGLLDLAPVMSGFRSALMQNGPAIPEGHYAAESMRQTVVPGRNLIMASVMAGLAESLGAGVIALGVHSGDHHIYPDCRPEFISSLKTTIEYSSAGAVSVQAPFSFDDKASILRRGYSYDFPVPYELTRTCYKAQEESCGKCGSCTERLEAFEALGRIDPIDYERD
jgi:7-cyano-7-deazaguanine synthase